MEFVERAVLAVVAERHLPADDGRGKPGGGRQRARRQNDAGGDRTLGTQMKATGEVMAIGRTFEAALLKATRSLEIGRRRASTIRSSSR